MKIHLDLPWGGVFDMETHPEKNPYKFYSVVWGIVLCVVTVAFFGIFK